jgi:hypothetical protein
MRACPDITATNLPDNASCLVARRLNWFRRGLWRKDTGARLRPSDKIRESLAWDFAGWAAVCAFGAALVAIALGLHIRGRVAEKRAG